jgi:hypothetical protein
VFCPPRLLLPERPEAFCLFLDELPACAPDVQKAFYSLLLERRLGEHELPKGTWVVAAGNRAQDRALVRSMSSALVNRVTILHVRVDVDEWLDWARRHRVRPEILSFIAYLPDALIARFGRARCLLDPAAYPCSRALDWRALASSRDAPRTRVGRSQPRTPRCSARLPRRRCAAISRPTVHRDRPSCRGAMSRAGSSELDPPAGARGLDGVRRRRSAIPAASAAQLAAHGSRRAVGRSAPPGRCSTF